jgi:hypothetical protein
VKSFQTEHQKIKKARPFQRHQIFFTRNDLALLVSDVQFVQLFFNEVLRPKKETLSLSSRTDGEGPISSGLTIPQTRSICLWRSIQEEEEEAAQKMSFAYLWYFGPILEKYSLLRKRFGRMALEAPKISIVINRKYIFGLQGSRCGSAVKMRK